MTMRPLRRVPPGRVVVVKASVILAAMVLALAGLVAACGPEQAADRAAPGAAWQDPPVNLAAGKAVEVSSSAAGFTARGANDNLTGTYWESDGFPADLTVKLGADADLTSVVLQLNPDLAWAARTQAVAVLGRARGESEFTSRRERADYAFDPAANRNTVTIPVTGRAADLRVRLLSNSGAPGGQVAEIQVLGTWTPDIDLRVASVTPDPPDPVPGTRVSFAVAVENRGTGTAPATITRLTVGDTTLTGDTPAIEGGQSTSVTLGPWTATGGGTAVTATADATGAVAEADENNDAPVRPIVVDRGAAVPYVSYEAEDARYRGDLVEADAKRTFGHTDFGSESSGRKSVRLTAPGQFVEFTSTIPANSIVVRNSIPDTPAGGGQEGTISLYVDDELVQKLTLSSRNSWLYGTDDDSEGLSNTPSPDARRLFDESHALLARSYPAGTRFRLQRDATDTAEFYYVDFIDLEQVVPALARPPGCASIASYGAVPDDGLDDTTAIQAAVTDNENGVIACVWIPEGRWRQEQKILSPDPKRGQYNQKGLRNVVIRGAGMWRSVLYTDTEPQNVAGNLNHPNEGNVGFDIDDNTQISDLAIFGMTTDRGDRGLGINGRFGTNTKISNVWIEHVNVGVWVGRDYSDTPAYWNPADGAEFSGMRIRDTYADGINLTNGTRNSRVVNSSFRTTGDDSLAVWANPRVRDPQADVASGNAFVNNTVQLPWRASGIAIYGGSGNTIENNLVYDTMTYPGIMLATDHDPQPFGGTTLIANNGLYRAGGKFWADGQEFGAITLLPSSRDITGVVIRDTDIADSTYDGIQFKAGHGAVPDVLVAGVRIDKPNNGAGIRAMTGAKGSATLTGVTVTNPADGDIVVQPGSKFVIN